MNIPNLDVNNGKDKDVKQFIAPRSPRMVDIYFPDGGEFGTLNVDCSTTICLMHPYKKYVDISFTEIKNPNNNLWYSDKVHIITNQSYNNKQKYLRNINITSHSEEKINNGGKQSTSQNITTSTSNNNEQFIEKEATLDCTVLIKIDKILPLSNVMIISRHIFNWLYEYKLKFGDIPIETKFPIAISVPITNGVPNGTTVRRFRMLMEDKIIKEKDTFVPIGWDSTDFTKIDKTYVTEKYSFMTIKDIFTALKLEGKDTYTDGKYKYNFCNNKINIKLKNYLTPYVECGGIDGDDGELHCIPIITSLLYNTRNNFVVGQIYVDAQTHTEIKNVIYNYDDILTKIKDKYYCNNCKKYNGFTQSGEQYYCSSCGNEISSFNESNIRLYYFCNLCGIGDDERFEEIDYDNFAKDENGKYYCKKCKDEIVFDKEYITEHLKRFNELGCYNSCFS